MRNQVPHPKLHARLETWAHHPTDADPDESAHFKAIIINGDPDETAQYMLK